MRCHKDAGLVNDVFTPENLRALGQGNLAVAHVRYGTTGVNPRQNAQPIVVNHVKGLMAMAHNGALTNAAELREELELAGAIFHMTSDLEIITHSIIRERLKAPSIEEAVSRAMDRLEGAYSLVDHVARPEADRRRATPTASARSAWANWTRGRYRIRLRNLRAGSRWAQHSCAILEPGRNRGRR